MKFKILLGSAFRSLRHHKMRSLLTTLGIIIGVVSIIAVMSIGEGAKHQVRQQIEKMGANFVVILAAPPKAITQRGNVYFTLKPSDVQAIKDECPEVYLISPGVQYQEKVITEGANWMTTVGGVNEDYLEIRQLTTTKGEFFTAQDVRASSKVVVLGIRVAKELYGDRDPIGTIVRIKKIPFRVIGVLSEQGRSPDGRDLDDNVLMPISTILRKLLGKTNYNALVLSVYHKEKMASASRQIRSILRQRHRLQPEDDDDFTIFTQDDAFQASEAASSILNLLLIIIASISLIVGGIGIMNIMLVTVTERTKEIGIRMALGATTANILIQFILEAITICLIGGILGCFVGIGISQFVGLLLQWPIFISREAVVISLSSAAFIGLFFGYYPALQASQMNPVEALLDQ